MGYTNQITFLKKIYNVNENVNKHKSITGNKIKKVLHYCIKKKS